MVSLLIMLAILLILFVLALKTSPIIVSPQVGFLIGFIVQIVFCLFYADDWRMNMDLKTIFTIVGGGALFCGISFLCDLIGRSIAPAKERRSTGIGQNYIEVESYKLIILACIQIIALAGYVLFLNANMNGTGLTAKIYDYRSRTADYGEVIPIPKVLSFCRLLSSASGYVLSLTFVYNLMNKTLRHRALFVLNIILSVLLEGILGARGGIMNFLIAIFAEVLIVRYLSLGKQMTISAFMKVMLAGVCAILALPVIGALMGRPSLGLWYEIAVYVGAPLRNLNTFLSDPANYSVRHASTLYYFLGDFSQFFKSFISIEAQKFPSKWQFLRDRTLGNVYTNYGLFWYDLAGWGVLIYVSVMALLFRILYRNLLSVKEIGSIKGMLFVVLYVYFYSTLVFAFFGNRFYSQFFSLYTVKFVIATITVALFIMRVRVSVEGKALT